MSLLYKLQKRDKYKTRIGCPVPYCREKKGSWWLCYNCGADVCKKHEVFNGKTVPYCAMCKPEKFGLDKNRRNTVSNIGKGVEK